MSADRSHDAAGGAGRVPEPGMTEPTTGHARYVMIGGFLGAGKTTSVSRLAERLSGRGLRVGLITNDQGRHLVDTTWLSARGFATEEIAGGCFCCRFNSLLEAARKLTAQTRPEVFIAEPVGSCTDLVATVSYPLRRIYGAHFSIAPLSVLVDPIRAARVLGLEDGRAFSGKVRYIYLKQLQEADLIVINKSDLLEAPQRARLRQALQERYPQAELFEASARSGAGLDAWFERISAGEQSARPTMEVDYEVYAQGEALLGWLNASLQVRAAEPFSGNNFLQGLAGLLQAELDVRGAEVAHLKMTLSPETGLGDLAVINLVRNDHVPELSQQLQDPLENGHLILNLRAELDSEQLHQAVLEALAKLNRSQPAVRTEVEHVEHFRPGKPVPTHRVQSAQRGDEGDVDTPYEFKPTTN